MDSVFRLKVPTGRELARVTAEGLEKRLRERSSASRPFLSLVNAGEWQVDRKLLQDADLLLMLREAFSLQPNQLPEHKVFVPSRRQFGKLKKAWVLWNSMPFWMQGRLLLGVWQWNWKNGGEVFADWFLLLVDENDLWPFFPVLEEHYIEYED